jgi:aspartate kinase
LKDGYTPIVSGFQGICGNNVTTLGRGGSDISAVAIAAKMNADFCDIYTDVDGVYAADPNIVPQTRKLPVISYEEMLEMASLGAGVLHARSVEIAMRYRIKLRVLSSFKCTEGTLLINEEEILEKNLITGITCNSSEARITVYGVQNVIDVLAPLAKIGINVNMIIQNINPTTKDVTITVPKTDLTRVTNIFMTLEVSVDEHIAVISVVGTGMILHPGVANKMFSTLKELGIEVLAITTSEIKISAIIHEDYRELALRSLHTAYELDVE